MARQATTAKPKKKKAKRKSVPKGSHQGGRRRFARRLRETLVERPLEIAEMAATLEVDESVVLVGLRDLRKKRNGQLHSGVVDGRNCWWWVPAGDGAPDGAPPDAPDGAEQIRVPPATDTGSG